MAPRKLSDSDKSEIVDLYREPSQTTSTLAEQYGVSNSTISRILKTSIPSEEYSELISQKRMTGSDKSAAPAHRKKAQSTVAKAQPVSETKTVPEFEPAANQPTADGSVMSASPTKVSPPKLKSADEEAPAESTAEEKPGTRRRRKRSRTSDEDTGQLPLLSNDAEATSDAETEAEVEEAPEKKRAGVGRPKPILASQRNDDDMTTMMTTRTTCWV